MGAEEGKLLLWTAVCRPCSSVDAVVAGSVFVRIITENKGDKDKLFEAVKAKAAEITHS